MRGCWRWVALAVLIGCVPASVLAAALRFEVGALEHPSLKLQGLSMVVADDGSSADIALDHLAVAGNEWRDVRLHCPDFRVALPNVHCAGARLEVAGLKERINLEFDFDVLSRRGDLRLRTASGDALRAQHRDGVLSVQLAGFRLSLLAQWLPALAAYSPQGVFDGRLDIAPDGSQRLNGAVVGGAFGSADGLQAAEGLKIKVDVYSRMRGDVRDFSGRLEWDEGEAYFHPFYLTARAGLSFAGQLRDDALEFSRFALDVDGAEAVEARATISLPDGTPRRFAIALASADLGVLGPRFIAPLIAPSRAASLGFDGRLSAGIVFDHGVLQSVDAVLDGVHFSDSGTSVEVGPVSGLLPWHVAERTQASLKVEGGRWQALQLGAFDVEAGLSGESLDIQRLEVPVLDGRLVLTDLALSRSPAGWTGSGGAVVEPVSMPLLSKAVGLPEMAGVLSASLPGLRVSPGEMALDGALVISVFDGYLRLTDLKVIEPFAVSSRLYSNLTARNLDLAQLTRTFSFGGMTGFIDIDVADLELVGWRPVRFDARVASSPGRYARRISQRAVENIGALAGPGAGLALQRSFLRFLDDFGYREIGLTCRLEGGVCVMGGIGSETTGSFDIVRGGGIPALNIIGYNRRVDWDELIGRIQRVIESNAAPVIR